MLEPVERRHLRNMLWRDVLASAALLAIPALLTLLIVQRATWFQRVDPNLVAFLGVVGGVWMVLLRRAPARALRIAADLRDDAHAEREGHASVLSRRGFGVFAPTHYRLLVAGKDFDATGFDPAVLAPGAQVRVRHALRSDVLLAVVPMPSGHSTDTPARPPAFAPPPQPGLTERECTLLQLLARGLSDKLIARELALAPATVRTYNSTLFRKLGVADRRGAIAWAQSQAPANVD